jgi:hypothetical protein
LQLEINNADVLQSFCLFEQKRAFRGLSSNKNIQIAENKLGIIVEMAVQEKLKVKNFEDRVSSIVSLLPSGVGRERLLGVYASLLLAELYGYTHDRFRERNTEDRRQLLASVTRAVLSDPTTWDEATREWVAGFYFNNSLLRMAATAEIGLKALFQRLTGLPSSPEDYWWLADWYKKRCSGAIGFLNRTRQEVNALKHGRRRNEHLRKLEKIHEAIVAFRELLVLMERLADAQQMTSTDG